MIQTLVNVFKVPELRNKVLFTLAMLFVFRIGHWIPLPGLDQEQLARMFNQASSEGSTLGKLANFVAIFSGGALSHSTIFGLGIMPYITAGIIIQLATLVVPAIKKLQEEGPTGRTKIAEYTRYITVALCIVQGMGWLGFLNQQGLIMPQWREVLVPHVAGRADRQARHRQRCIDDYHGGYSGRYARRDLRALFAV
jgi:preprotein translocase subunit SecY